MKKGELKKHNKDYLDYKTILTTMLCTLVGVLFILCFIFVGIRMASGESIISANNEDIEIIAIDYSLQQYDYVVQDWQIAKDTKAPYIFTDLETKYSGGRYAVINSRTQLNTLMQTLNSITSGDNFYGVGADDNFFESSSVVAIALEDINYSSYNIASITRNEDYNLQINIDAVRLADDAITERDSSDSDLFLVRVPNIQPRSVDVVINEITE